MAKVISFISRKGGTGKTTNAINLATTLNTLGKRVVLVETDTNYTLNTLRKMAKRV
jgi:chromosome partitioning protein